MCEPLKRLLRTLAPIEGLYRGLIEPRLGYPGYRETLAQLRAACDPALACINVALLERAVRGRVVCIHGPLSPGEKGYCEVDAGPESALVLALEAGVRLAYVTGDMDASQKLLASAPSLADVYIAHLHGDNFHAQPPPHPRLLYSSQVAPSTGCIIAPLGFTDGDRAAILAMALGALEVRLLGFATRPTAPHKDYARAQREKEVKLLLSAELLRKAAAILGYDALGGPGFPEIVKR